MPSNIYFVTIDDEEHEVQITEQQGGLYHMLLDGHTRVVDAQPTSGDVVSLLIDGISYDADIEYGKTNDQDAAATHLNIRVHGSVFPLEVLDARSRNLRDIAGSAAGVGGRQEITAPMPGKVVKLLVAQGDEVKKGQGLVVVEAMKMENEIQSPQDGTILEVRAEAGTAVESGAVLLIIE